MNQNLDPIIQEILEAGKRCRRNTTIIGSTGPSGEIGPSI